jgi:tRNA pseudouridine55 synthase
MLIPSGLLAVRKPKDWTSNDVVQKVRVLLQREAKAILGEKRKVKVGHGGTLDPMAEGVLVLGVGEGTKMMTEYLAGGKSYVAEALLGFETNTLDSTGNVTVTKDCSSIVVADLESQLPNFTGEITQVPPMFSALKHNGKRLYDLAREGIEVERESRTVTVKSLRLEQGDLELPYFGLYIESSGGFYVRTLIEDLAQASGGCAHMTALERTAQGPFTLEDCIGPGEWDFANICSAITRSSEKVGIDVHKIKPAVSQPVDL